ncbi:MULTISPECIES: hypothetical protein [unclassified Streptomyces]|uniref:hypothetical protein n=1 Tax=Streptomyces sp. NPDC127129 TaxID=3345373 RepID=UPI00363E9AA1
MTYAELCDMHNDGRSPYHVPEVESKNDGSVMKAAHRIAADGREVDLSLWADAATGARATTTYTDRSSVRSIRIPAARSRPEAGPGDHPPHSPAA